MGVRALQFEVFRPYGRGTEFKVQVLGYQSPARCQWMDHEQLYLLSGSYSPTVYSSVVGLSDSLRTNPTD